MQNRLSWTQTACARILRPMVRLALAMGLKHAHLEGLLRDLLLDEARRLWKKKGVTQPNISQLSVTTGLNRKDVTQRVRELRDPLPHTELSAAAKVVTGWLQLIAEHPGHRHLPIASEGEGPSFEALARQVSRGDVHHRAVLDDLIRLGMVVVHGAQAELTTDAFVPTLDLQTMLAFLGDNSRDHLLAAVSNTLGEAPRMLERAVFAGGLRAQDCEQIEQFARQRWEQLHHELVAQMTQSLQTAAGTGGKRIRVGIYTYYEDENEGGSPEEAARPRPLGTAQP